MYLYVKTEHKNLYEHHSIAYEGDSGIDLFFPAEVHFNPKETKLIDLEISCEMKKTYLTIDNNYFSYYIYPRSSIYKTPLRMANSVGIIDSKYRNTLKIAVDNISDQGYTLTKNTKLFQICSPDLEPIKLIFVDKLSATERGSGFGSSGK